MSTEAGWSHFAHVADIGVEGFGPTMAVAFEQAALAMTAVAVEPQAIHSVDTVQIRCEAPDPELLLVDWLNALVYEMSTRSMLFSEFHVAIEGRVLHGSAKGETIVPGRHQPAAEVKGATLTALEVRRSPDGMWHARCVVDV